MDQYSNLYPGNSPYLEEQFQKFQTDPQSVEHEWRAFFESLNAGYDMVSQHKKGHNSTTQNSSVVKALTTSATAASSGQNRVTRLIQAYRDHGHHNAHIDPLSDNAILKKDLSLDNFGIGEDLLNEEFDTDGLLSPENAPLKDILQAVKRTYTESIGVQYQNLTTHDERRWLKQKMEPIQNKPNYDIATKKRILKGLMVAERFENFLHTKYVGKKRFSGEGADAVIPMLDTMIDMCGEFGATDIVVGMAHRGRLNVMVNIFQKPLEQIFASFDETLIYEDAKASSDVKYHMGKSYDVTTRSGHKVHMSLLNNPSHLEAVNPVVAGSVRAKQERHGLDGFRKVVPLIVHGDSAFAGQGIVPETLNMANLEGYTNKGTIHLIINNQVGFTAAPSETFSGEYCTDIARMLQVPIFHVNGDDAEACNHVMEMAMEYRNNFGKDVFIDLVCYRKYGHNEGDDPTFTNPVLYSKIKNHPSPYKVYKDTLIQNSAIAESESKGMEDEYHEELSKAFEHSREKETTAKPDMFGGAWENFSKEAQVEPETAISTELTAEIANCYTDLPEGFEPHKKIFKGMEKRKAMLDGQDKLDWGAAEVSAYAALLKEGYDVRISGQDVKRGTFSHRHAALWDMNTGETYMPISKFAHSSTSLQVWNSSLSELAVVGFEFGYSLASPKTLTVWEAQFGDFSNGCQIIIDQFISSSEQKWNRMSGLVMLLPHGYEGQGPEHSSARAERYLQLCAENNMTVANCSTPAQIFHLLRRQVLRKIRRPLVVLTPKSLLRHPMATSSVDKLTSGRFEHVLDDPDANAGTVKKVILCTGKIYYDLLGEKLAKDYSDVAIIRLEQLYPTPVEKVKELLVKYSGAEDFIWVQEEPKNQGFWTFIRENLSDALDKPLTCISRPPSASPAVGSMTRHIQEQKKLLNAAFE
jgi:2-oxoglutarate dehydrogenase E1 component